MAAPCVPGPHSGAPSRSISEPSEIGSGEISGRDLAEISMWLDVVYLDETDVGFRKDSPRLIILDDVDLLMLILIFALVFNIDGCCECLM